VVSPGIHLALVVLDSELWADDDDDDDDDDE
jgi:hypothetical protein